MQKFYRDLAEKANRRNQKKFFAVPFGRRILLLPHCLRNSKKCKAREVGFRYVCMKCAACSIGKIQKQAEKLGYQDVYILKGGRAVIEILQKSKPGAILGVACHFEGSPGITECEKAGIPAYFVPLSKDGCTDTAVDVEELIRVMRKTLV